MSPTDYSTRAPKFLVLAVVTLLIGAVALGLVAADSDGQADPSEAGPTIDSTIHVTSTGEVIASPDQGVVSVELTERGNDTEMIAAALATSADELETSFEELGVEYETTGYGLSEPFRADERPYQYVGTHSFEVTTDDPDGVGSVIDAATGVGAEIRTVQFTLSDEKAAALLDEAIEDAMTEARSQAETIAAADGLDIVHAATVDATQRSVSPFQYRTDDVAEAIDEPAETAETTVEPGEASITYDVDVTYNATNQ